MLWRFVGKERERVRSRRGVPPTAMADENPVVEPVEHAPPLWAVLQQAMDGFVAWLQESGSWLTESTKNNSMLGAIVIMGLITTVPSLFERAR